MNAIMSCRYCIQLFNHLLCNKLHVGRGYDSDRSSLCVKILYVTKVLTQTSYLLIYILLDGQLSDITGYWISL